MLLLFLNKIESLLYIQIEQAVLSICNDTNQKDYLGRSWQFVAVYIADEKAACVAYVVKETEKKGVEGVTNKF